VSSFIMSYFDDPWNLLSPSSLMEGIWHLGMVMHLSVAEVAYIIVQQALTYPDLAPSQELDPVLEPIWAQDSLATQDPLDLVFPSNEVILEEMTGSDRPWDDLHHRSYFLPELRREEVGEFVLTMNGYSPCPINPLATLGVNAKGNMEIISTMISINISRTPDIVENFFIESYFSPKEI
jgi:hypothetical protein